jgi:nuclear GTP-binding protein
VAKARGKLKPGGVPDVLRAAKVVIEDWNRGKIRYFSRVPEAIET